MLSRLDELLRDKQGEDWSNWAGFEVNGLPPILGTEWRWEVLANNAVCVGIYDTLDEAKLVKAKLTYRLKERHCGQIGMDGIDDEPIRCRPKALIGNGKHAKG